MADQTQQAGKRTYAPAAYSAITPQSLLDYVGAQFGPLAQTIERTQQGFSYLPMMGTAAAQPLLEAAINVPSVVPQMAQHSRLGAAAISSLPFTARQHIGELTRGVAEVFERPQNAAQSLLATVMSAPMDRATQRAMERRARNFMRLARAVGPEMAWTYTMLSGQMAPVELLRMQAPSVAATLAQLATGLEAARLQGLGAALPGVAQAYSVVPASVPQAMAQVAMAPLQAALQSEASQRQARLAAAQLAQTPALAAMQAYPELSRQWLAAAATPGTTAAELARTHQTLALSILPELLGIGSAQQ